MIRKHSKLKLVLLAGIVLVLAFMLCACNLIQSVDDAESGHATPPPVVDADSGYNELDWDNSYISLTVECLSLLNGKLSNHIPTNIKPYIPEDGYIFNNIRVKISKGDTAFSVLVRICQENDIDIRYSYNAVYQSYYVESINMIKEKMLDKATGRYSGWVYKVNNVSPNYGMSGYRLVNDEQVVISYIC